MKTGLITHFEWRILGPKFSARVTRAVLVNQGEPTLAEVNRVATELARRVQFPWRTNDQASRSAIKRQLQDQESGVREARHQFQSDATFAAKRETRKLVADVRLREAAYEKIGTTVAEHKDLLAKKDKVEAQVRQLASRVSSENPLSGFPNFVKADAAREVALQLFLKSWEHPADAPGALRAFNEELKGLNNAWPPTAFDQLASALGPNMHIGDPRDHWRIARLGPGAVARCAWGRRLRPI